MSAFKGVQISKGKFKTQAVVIAKLRSKLGPQVPSVARSSELEVALSLARLAWKAYGNPNETLGAPLTAAERERVSAMSLRELVMEIRAGDELALQLAARVCPSEGRYIGVNRHKGKFRVVLRVPGIGQRVLGQFATASQAARAFDDAAYQQFGESAVLNWPEKHGLPPNEKRIALVSERLSGAFSGGLKKKSGDAPAAKARRVIAPVDTSTEHAWTDDDVIDTDEEEDDEDFEAASERYELWNPWDSHLYMFDDDPDVPVVAPDVYIDGDAPVVDPFDKEGLSDAALSVKMDTAASLAAALSSDELQVMARAIAIYQKLDEPTMRMVYELAKRDLSDTARCDFHPDEKYSHLPPRKVPDDMPNMQDHAPPATWQDLFDYLRKLLTDAPIDESADAAIEALVRRYREAPLSECRPDLVDPDNDNVAGAMWLMACASKAVDYTEMDWASAEAHKDKLAEWGLDGEPECRVNPFNAHRGVGGCTAQTDAMEPDAMQRLPAALLDMVRRGDGTITPGVGISAEQLPPRPPSPPARPPAHRGSQLHHAEWREIRETWKKILDGHPRYKNITDMLGITSGEVDREGGLKRLESLFGPHVAEAVAFRDATPEPAPPPYQRGPRLPGRPCALFPLGTHISLLTGQMEPIDTLQISGDETEPGYDLEWFILEFASATGYGPPGPEVLQVPGFLRYAQNVFDFYYTLPTEERIASHRLQVINRRKFREEQQAEADAEAADDGVLRL